MATPAPSTATAAIPPPSAPSASLPAHASLEIHPTSETIIMRASTAAESETEPATLSGHVVLSLPEATSIKDVELQFVGKAKLNWAEGHGTAARNHHYDQIVISHTWSFLETASGKKSFHTLKAGVHSFPFSLPLNYDLPPSMRTATGTAFVYYKLKATAVRSTFAANLHARKAVQIYKPFRPDSLEFTQTLEIENTWPNKIMYAITLPQRAYAAGDKVPVSIKFSPLVKGVKVTAVHTNIKEYTVLYAKNATKSESRLVISTKHEVRRRAGMTEVQEAPDPYLVAANRSRIAAAAAARGGTRTAPSSPSLEPQAGGNQDVPPIAATPSQGGAGGGGSGSRRPSFRTVRSTTSIPRLMPTMGLAPLSHSPRPPSEEPTSASAAADLLSSTSTSSPAHGPVPAPADRGEGSSTGAGTRGADEEDEDESGDINARIDIPIPLSTTPSNAHHPINVTHKIKWSCMILNPDGHTSELRCALPIHILCYPLLEEARVASQAARNLLFGLTDGNEETSVLQADLPSYSDHVYDRVANAELAALRGDAPPLAFSFTGGGAGAGPQTQQHRFVPAPWTPFATPHPSRPSSPRLGASSVGQDSYFPTPVEAWSSAPGSGASSPRNGRMSVSFGPNVVQPTPSSSHWSQDSELLASLGRMPPSSSLQTTTNSEHASSASAGGGSQPGSRDSSRPNSRPSSRNSSRPTSSRPSSPSFGETAHAHAPSSSSRHHHGSASVPTSPTDAYAGGSGGGSGGGGGERPEMHHRNSSSSSLHRMTGGVSKFHLPSSIRPLTSWTGSSSSHKKKDKHYRHGDASEPTTAGSSPSASRRSSMVNLRDQGTTTTAAAVAAAGSHSAPHSAGLTPPPDAASSSGRTSEQPSPSHHHHHHQQTSPPPPQPAATDTRLFEDPLSQVPSYDIAARGFLGGGVVPLSAYDGLPTYGELESSTTAAVGEGGARVVQRLAPNPPAPDPDAAAGMDDQTRQTLRGAAQALMDVSLSDEGREGGACGGRVDWER